MSDDIGKDIDSQIEMQGVASYKVDDGEVFVFTTAFLEKLLETSREQGRVIVLVKTRPGA